MTDHVTPNTKEPSIKSHHHADEHDHHEHGDGFGDDMPLYIPVRQRQRWGDAQHPVHGNWGDIFFDLFYVALAYNLGNILRENPTMQGLLYLCACFLPVMGIWHLKMYWDSRFVSQGDIFHMLLEVATFASVASAVQHVRPVVELTDLQNSVDMFCFCLAILIGHVLALGRIVEVVVRVKVFQTEGVHEEAYHAVKRDAIWVCVPAIFYFAAVVYTGRRYFGSSGDDEGDHRNLAEKDPSVYSDKPDEDETPAWFCIVGAITSQLVVIAIHVIWVPYVRKSGVDARTLTIPMNIDYTIHRYGEWTMLLLGESVLSLLIVEPSNGASYYQTFFCGVLSVILLQYLHFRSQPHDPDEHAMRRSVLGGFVFTILMDIYSVALVVLGTSYKMFLYEFDYEKNDSDKRFLSPIFERLLAAETNALNFETDDRQQRIANFFCGSLAIVFICLDGMSLAHKGLGTNYERCQCKESKQVRGTVIALLVFRVALILFFLTLELYRADPAELATLGFVGIVLQLGIRVLGEFMFPADEDLQEDEALNRVANYLNARIES